MTLLSAAPAGTAPKTATTGGERNADAESASATDSATSFAELVNALAGQTGQAVPNTPVEQATTTAANTGAATQQTVHTAAEHAAGTPMLDPQALAVRPPAATSTEAGATAPQRPEPNSWHGMIPQIPGANAVPANTAADADRAGSLPTVSATAAATAQVAPGVPAPPAESATAAPGLPLLAASQDTTLDHGVPQVAAAAPATAAAPEPAASIDAAQPPRTGTAPPPLHRQLAGPIATLVTGPDGQGTLSIKVAPDTLGPVSVTAHLGADGVLRVDLAAPSEAGRDALRAMLPELRRDLAATGHGSVSVSTDADGSTQSGEDGSHRDTAARAPEPQPAGVRSLPVPAASVVGTQPGVPALTGLDVLA